MRTAVIRKSKRDETENAAAVVESLSEQLPSDDGTWNEMPSPTLWVALQRQRRRRRKRPGRRQGPALKSWLLLFLVLAFVVIVLLLTMLVSRAVRQCRLWVLTRPSRRPFILSAYDPAGAVSSSGALDSYRPVDAMSSVGDFSPRYARIRYWIDQQLPPHRPRTMARVQQLTVANQARPTPYAFEEDPSALTNSSAERQQPLQYDVFDCPNKPPPRYPFDWNLMRILNRWNVDDARVPANVHQSVCVFDWERDRHKIRAYRDAEVPFVVSNDPSVLRTVERWNVPNYLETLIGPEPHSCERSSSNHFLFFRSNRHLRANKDQHLADGDENPSSSLRNQVETLMMPFSAWVRLVQESGGGYIRYDQPHTYFRLSAFGANPMKQLQSRQKLLKEQRQQREQELDGATDGSLQRPERPAAVLHEPLAEYLFNELPFFQPGSDSSGGSESLYMTDPAAQHGIYCRFGMVGLRAASHFDLGRNAIVVLKGRRRYVLGRPEQCKNLALFPRDHPSGRHSMVDWSRPDLYRFPEFAKALGNEVVLEAGQVLWLPSLYFHMIVSLEGGDDDNAFTVQCNTRSGDPPWTKNTFRDCGF